MDCICLDPQKSSYKDFTSQSIGIDRTNGRYGECSILSCKHCGRNWGKYFIEFEHFSKSGRWYRGELTQELLRKITPENMVEILESLDWRICGGSYFNSTGMINQGKLKVDAS